MDLGEAIEELIRLRDAGADEWDMKWSRREIATLMRVGESILVTDYQDRQWLVTCILWGHCYSENRIRTVRLERAEEPEFNPVTAGGTVRYEQMKRLEESLWPVEEVE